MVPPSTNQNQTIEMRKRTMDNGIVRKSQLSVMKQEEIIKIK